MEKIIQFGEYSWSNAISLDCTLSLNRLRVLQNCNLSAFLTDLLVELGRGLFALKEMQEKQSKNSFDFQLN